MTSANRSLLAFASILLVAGLLAMACGDDGPNDAPAAGGVGDASGPGISIAEALASKLDEPLLVNGWLWRQANGEVRLCTTLSATTPARCGGPSLAVVGLDLEGRPDLQSQQGTTTSTKPAQVLGTVSGGVITVARNISG